MQEMGVSEPTTEAWLKDFFTAWLEVSGLRGMRQNKEEHVYFAPTMRNGQVLNIANRTNGLTASAAYLALLAAPYVGRQTYVVHVVVLLVVALLVVALHVVVVV